MLSFEDFTKDARWKTKVYIFAMFYSFTSVKGKTRVKLVQSCVKFTVAMLYKNVSANDGFKNFVMVILILMIHLGQEGPPRLMTTKSRH